MSCWMDIMVRCFSLSCCIVDRSLLSTKERLEKDRSQLALVTEMVKKTSDSSPHCTQTPEIKSLLPQSPPPYPCGVFVFFLNCLWQANAARHQDGWKVLLLLGRRVQTRINYVFTKSVLLTSTGSLHVSRGPWSLGARDLILCIKAPLFSCFIQSTL